MTDVKCRNKSKRLIIITALEVPALKILFLFKPLIDRKQKKRELYNAKNNSYNRTNGSRYRKRRVKRRRQCLATIIAIFAIVISIGVWKMKSLLETVANDGNISNMLSESQTYQIEPSIAEVEKIIVMLKKQYLAKQAVIQYWNCKQTRPSQKHPQSHKLKIIAIMKNRLLKPGTIVQSLFRNLLRLKTAILMMIFLSVIQEQKA